MNAHVGSSVGYQGAEPERCCSCPWSHSESHRGSGYVRDAAIVTLHLLTSELVQIGIPSQQQSRLKGEHPLCFSLLSIFFPSLTLPHALEKSLLTIHPCLCTQNRPQEANQHGCCALWQCSWLCSIRDYAPSIEGVVYNRQDAIRRWEIFRIPLSDKLDLIEKSTDKMRRASNTDWWIFICVELTPIWKQPGS